MYDNNKDAVRVLRSLLETAIAAAQPACCLPQNLPQPSSRTVVIGAGKASAAMAQCLEREWSGIPVSGLVLAPYGYGAACEQIEVLEAGHPLPDGNCVAGARRMMSLVTKLGADDLVVALISGGGSALLTLPPAGISLEEKREVNRALLRSGATIAEMNCIRKHISAIKGGRLAAACYPARLITLLISDVPGDDPATIASGPTVGDNSSAAQARTIIDNRGISLSTALNDFLRSPAAETNGLESPIFSRNKVCVIASPMQSLQAAARQAEQFGLRTQILGDAIEGEAMQVGIAHAGIAKSCRRHGQPSVPPVLLLSGGETTVTMNRTQFGRGGPNQEFLLGLAQGLGGEPGIHALAADTDGVDGSEPVAGATIHPDTLARAGDYGISLDSAVDGHDSYAFFEALDDLVKTGPTFTNVNDFRAILVA